MKQFQIIFIISFLQLISCQKTKENTLKIKYDNKIEVDTTKRYHRITIQGINGNEITEEFEAYVTKQKDTFWNTWKYYNNGIIDSTRSNFFTFKIEGQKNDSIMKGEVSFFSPADSIPLSKIKTREVTFVYMQKEKDSVYVKEITTDKNTILFDYKNYSFEGHIIDLRFIEMDSMPDELLLNRNYFTIDTKSWTDNIFVDLLKE